MPGYSKPKTQPKKSWAAHFGTMNYPSMQWKVNSIGDLTGKTILITGANSGIGLEAFKILGAKGATMIMASRNPDKANKALEHVRSEVPNAKTDFIQLDLASLASVKAAANAFKSKYDKLDILINNGGVAWHPRKTTADGFELHFGTNHLGHFALGGHLLGSLLKADSPRIVAIASIAHRFGYIHFDDLQLEKGYNMFASYGQSKMANLLYTFELNRLAQRAGVNLMPVAAHPGMSSTNLATSGIEGHGQSLLAQLTDRMQGLVTQSAYDGSLPTVRAATDPEAAGGDYYGPRDLFEAIGPPVKVGTNDYAKREDVAAQLWQVSEELTGVKYEFD